MLEATIIGIVLGFISASLSDMADTLMSKGHILDFIRDKYIPVDIEDDFEGFQDRTEKYSEAQWIKGMDKKYTVWICPFCFGMRFILPLFIGLGFLMIDHQWISAILFVTTIIATYNVRMQ